MNNKKEFKELIEKYESITIDDINDLSGCDIEDIAQKLTGFGHNVSCTLCLSVYDNCRYCTWEELTLFSCMLDGNRKTYCNIEDAKTPEQLLKAFKARAKYMKEVLNFKKSQNEN